MTASFTRARSRRVIRLGVPLVALVTIALALVLPGLGSARTQSPGEPTISGGTSVGDTLTGDPGTWAPGAASYKYNWRRCPPDGGQGAGNCEGIIDGPSNQYVLQPGDVGFTIRLQVKAFDGGGGKIGVNTSNATAKITGHRRRPDEHRAADGHGYRRRRADADREPGELGEQVPRRLRQRLAALRRRPAAIARPSARTARRTSSRNADKGSTLRARVTATNPAGTTQVSSDPTTVVPGAPPVALPAPAYGPAAADGRRLPRRKRVAQVSVR